MFLYSVRSKSKNRPVNYIDAYPTKNMGIAGRFTYAFRDKYFAEFNFGYNGSENFAPGKRYGFFPSYAVGYMISNEKFWEPLRDKVNILKSAPRTVRSVTTRSAAAAVSPTIRP